jgi:hypothetical protein
VRQLNSQRSGEAGLVERIAYGCVVDNAVGQRFGPGSAGLLVEYHQLGTKRF